MPGAEKDLPEIRFRALADALLDRAAEVVPRWLPGGRTVGHEYECAHLGGGEGTSCKVNLTNGKWSDFATGEAGGDLLSLYGAIHDLPAGKAARQVAIEEALEDVAGIVLAGPPGARPPSPPRPAPPPAAERTPEGWKTQLPVPPTAPEPTFRHYARLPADIVNKANYRVGGQLLGFVVRFRTSDGGKDDLPYTWCVSAIDGGAKWHWRQFDTPRPLYLPSGEVPNGRTVVLVEGEIKAAVLQQLLDQAAPGVYCVASWPGGCKAWAKAAWTWLEDCTVLLWPDCDAKREKLTAKERKACLDEAAIQAAEATKPLRPAIEQPGMQAMLGIGALLKAHMRCTVSLLPIPAPGEVKDGWDARDAIEGDGWDAERVLAFFGQAQPLPEPPKPEAPPPDKTDPPAGGKRAGGGGGGKAPPPGGGGRSPGDAEDDGDDPFAEYLDFVCDTTKQKRWELAINRKVLITALRKAPALSECLGFDDLRNAPCTAKPWPWRDKAGPLSDSDDLRCGDWLSQEYGLRAASRAALAEAIDTVADERHFHPIRDWLRAQVHDGKKRLDHWLVHVLKLDETKLSERQRTYFALMGKYLLMGLVARVMDPGCKFDYSPVIEGVPGRGKSTFVKALVGKEFFSDTHFDIGNGKDGMEQLEGLWAYELSEMTAFRRADSEQIKQFFSSTVDRFRGAYGRFVQPHPRQCVIFCTTNKRQYLYDLTGNRRFWPVWIEQQIDIAWLEERRGQLFAEALAAYERGDRYFPTLEEEEAYFVPEQRKRLVETSVQSRLYELLTREGAPGGEGKLSSELNQNTGFVTLHQLVAALGADAAKSTNMLEAQIRSWLEAMGWTSGRESTGQRRRGFKKPQIWPPAFEDDEDAPPPAGGAPGGPPPAGPSTEEPGPSASTAWEEGRDDEPF